VIFLVYCSSKHDIPQRCSQPWLVGVLGGPVVPAHQPRQIINGIQTQRPTVLKSIWLFEWNIVNQSAHEGFPARIFFLSMNIANQSAREGFPARIFFLLMNIVNQSAREGFPARIFFQISRTEALLCAHSKACNRRPVWRTTSLNNQLNEEFDLVSGSKYGFDAHTLFYPYALKVFKLKKVRSLKLLLVVNIQTYVYGPSRALGKKH